jgi:predicted Zn-dependent protease with MMP-like domain
VIEVTPERFEELVAEACDGLPEWIRERLDNVDVLVERRPPPGQENLLGYYHGVPLTKRGSNYTFVPPDRIVLFRSNLLRAARTEDELRERIRRTVVHEFAHFFGISDRRLRELGAY